MTACPHRLVATALTACMLALLTAGCPVAPPLPDAADDTNGLLPSTPAANQAPVADAGDDQTVVVGTELVLDGTGSNDPDGDQLMYLWRQVAGTPRLTLDRPFVVISRVTLPSDIPTPTTLTFELLAMDGRAVTRDTVDITIVAAP
jgi:hypothetical protein